VAARTAHSQPPPLPSSSPFSERERNVRPLDGAALTFRLSSPNVVAAVLLSFLRKWSFDRNGPVSSVTFPFPLWWPLRMLNEDVAGISLPPSVYRIKVPPFPASCWSGPLRRELE